MNQIPNYDAYKLASPYDQHHGLCRDCDADVIRDQSKYNAWIEFKPFNDQFQASKSSVEKLIAKLTDEGSFDIIIDHLCEILEDIEDAQDDMLMRLNDEHLDKLQIEIGLCRQCHDDDHADDDRDEY